MIGSKEIVTAHKKNYNKEIESETRSEKSVQ